MSCECFEKQIFATKDFLLVKYPSHYEVTAKSHPSIVQSILLDYY